MSFDKGRHRTASADRPVSTGSDRRTFLTVLDDVVRVKPGLACGIVYEGGTPTLNVISTSTPRKSVKVGCDYTDDDWWFTWAADGQTIGPVDNPEAVAHVVAVVLGVEERQSEIP